MNKMNSIFCQWGILFSFLGSMIAWGVSLTHPKMGAEPFVWSGLIMFVTMLVFMVSYFIYKIQEEYENKKSSAKALNSSKVKELEAAPQAPQHKNNISENMFEFFEKFENRKEN